MLFQWQIKMEYLSQVNLDTIVEPRNQDLVFKDDCMFSFDTAFDTNGLDICLTCHQAFNRGEINYTQMHSEFFDHRVFLNYKKVAKPQTVRDKEEKPLKMLKLEIKYEAESDLYDTECKLYCQQIDQFVDLRNPKLPLEISNTVDKILKSTSNERKEEIKSWTQDIKTCSHASGLVQAPNPDINLQQCGSCDLKENLWICLHCGNIGCGRQQFGGVPGNSHAIDHHSSQSSHHIAVKLGSLTFDSADAYCYTCDDEVKVPNLAKFLKTFGIDITSFVKTEKNLTELQIEQNTTWDFNMDNKDGSVLQPVFGKGLTGFKNLGNSCYMASVLQLLFSIDTFQQAFENEDGMPLNKILGNYEPWKDLETQMFKLADGLYSGRYSIPDETTKEKVKYQKGIKPAGFKSLIGEGHPEFSTVLQQDAFEFWGYLIDQLERGKVNGKLNKLPTEVMKFVLETKIKCTACSGIRITNELGESISIPIKEDLISSTNEDKTFRTTNLDEGIAVWKSPENIEYECSDCNKKVVAIKTVRFESFPEFLVINPMRIKLENWVPTKVTVPISVQDELSIDELRPLGKTINEHYLSDNSESSYEFSASALQSLLDMGFSENRAKRALYNTGNSNAEIAMNWLFEHMEDPDIDELFTAPVKTMNEVKIDEESLSMMLAMGLDTQLCKKALIVNNGNVEQAVEWVFSHPDDDGQIVINDNNSTNSFIEKLKSEQQNEGKYRLLGVICHKGVSTHSGHYVAFIKKDVNGEEKWVLFNDEKVVLVDELSLKEIETSSYIYVYQRI